MNYPTIEEHPFITIFCSKCGHSHKARQYCGNRFCPVCSRNRQIRVRGHLSELFKCYKHRPKYSLKMLTLSTANCKDLRKGVDHLISSFRRLRNAKKWGLYVDGGVCVVEIKGRPNSWHPHLHIIIYSKYLPWQWLQNQWLKCSGGRAVWISQISKDKAIYYVTKYVTKIDMPDEAQDEPNTAMKGRRLFMKFGEFANLRVPVKKWLWICPVCQTSDFLTEFEIRRFSKKPI